MPKIASTSVYVGMQIHVMEPCIPAVITSLPEDRNADPTFTLTVFDAHGAQRENGIFRTYRSLNDFTKSWHPAISCPNGITHFLTATPDA